MEEKIIVDGITFNLHNGAELNRNYRHATIKEIFEKDVYNFSSVPDKGTVIDVGANIGGFSIRCAAKKNCVVYAYEPSPHTFSILEKNVIDNNLQHLVKPFNNAVGDVNGTVKFYYCDKHPNGSSLYEKQALKYGYSECDVQSITIKDIFEANDLSTCDFLKVDAECAEALIFKPEFSEYIRRVQVIALEWHMRNKWAIAQFLESLGFDVGDISEKCGALGVLHVRKSSNNPGGKG